MSRSRLSRRTVLRGLGVAVSLPWLEAMGPVAAWAAPKSAGKGAAKPQIAPNRMAFVYVPNGKNMVDWTPQQDGADFELPKILESLAPHKQDILVLTGLTADKARSHGDGGGDHARALAAYLTGAHPFKTDGTDIRAGVSVDQVAAARIGEQTRLASIELGCEQGSLAGNCDSGYSCLYSSTMSWRSATQPLPKETNPKLAFERLFGGGIETDQVKRDKVRRSVLDFVREDAGNLQKKVSGNDARKLDEYFSSIRDIELRIARAASMPALDTPEYPKPKGTPDDYQEHIRLMCDLVVLAFQADVTRVATFVMANESSNRPYPTLGISDGHHDISHHGGDARKKDKIREINKFHVSQLNYLLTRLKSIQEGDGTLLDHSMIAYGSGNSDGDAHNHDNLPILLAGKGGGTIQPGRHIIYPRETPLNNLWVAMLERMDVKIPFLGDSTESLPKLAG